MICLILWMHFQGQKRKLGLLEDDDMDEPNFGAGRTKDDSTGFTKIRGMLILLLLRRVCSMRNCCLSVLQILARQF